VGGDALFGPPVEQGLSILPGHLSSPPVFSGIRVARSLACCVVLCRSLFVLLSFFIWSLCCLAFFDLQILITPLVSKLCLLTISLSYVENLLYIAVSIFGSKENTNGKITSPCNK
jgi:hypothetical protein